MASKKKDVDELTVVTWNLAGVNSNAFEFKLNMQDARFAAANSFGQSLNDLNKLLTMSGDPDKKADMTDVWVKKMSVSYRKLLGPLLAVIQKVEGTGDVKKGTAGILKACLDSKVGDCLLADSLFQALHGNSGFSKADMEFKARSWSFTNLRPTNVKAFMESCKGGPAGEAEWWLKWITDLSHTEAFQRDQHGDKLMKHFIPLAVFDNLLYHGVCFALENEKFDLTQLVKQLKGFIDSMNVDVEQKAKGISDALNWVIKSYEPEIISIQENNKFWQKLDSFKVFWDHLETEYHIFDPNSISNPQQVVQLLIKKSKDCVVDTKATESIGSIVKSKAFLAKVRAELAKHTEFTPTILDEQVEKVKKIVETTWVPAVFTTSKGTRVLACAAHGNSKGTDNRAIIAVTVLLSRELRTDVVLGMDANSNNVCKAKDVKHGAGSRRKFNEFVEQYKPLESCFPSTEIEEKPAQDSVCKYHTVRKERTYLQMQIKKADKLDQSLKDWVITNYHATKTVRVNKFSGSATWSEASGNVWDTDSCMPNSLCPSDHCMLISHLVCPSEEDAKVHSKVANFLNEVFPTDDDTSTLSDNRTTGTCTRSTSE